MRIQSIAIADVLDLQEESISSLHVSTVESRGSSSPRPPHARTMDRWLLLLFVLSLPLLNPWVRGDGVGYYALARAPLIEHDLDFQHDYQEANDSFRGARLDENGQPKPIFRTRTGHLENHFSVGPAILWAPFLLLTHAGVLLARALGSSVPADGFSEPYRIAMAFGTALYGFLGLLLAVRLARNYVKERWAFLAAISMWWASSLPVYMYFNPSWSHTHSAFTVALFLWYWHETREQRSVRQWCVLALIAGLMLNVYYANAMILAALVVEAVPQYAAAFRHRTHDALSVGQLLARHLLFAGIVAVCLLPTFITRTIIYGHPFESGYIPLKDWLWRSPVFLAVLFSSNHGLIAWTPVVLFAVIGLFLFWRREPRVGTPILAATLAFYVFISCYPDWAGISSFGNRFFISLTAIFVLGLSVLLDRVARLFRSPRVALGVASAFLGCLILWNAAFMFQWGTHLVPVRGRISWSEMIQNQFFVVPREISAKLQSYFFHRSNLMRQIERRDIEQIQKGPVP
jgi:Dolichyl-phosphate-mannose-protein mannosyltransferase